MNIKIIFKDFKEQVIFGVNSIKSRPLYRSWDSSLTVEFDDYSEIDYENVHSVEVML